MLQNGGKINLDGGTINVGRDMEQHIGEIDLNGGKITVKRNLLQSHIMYINSGELDVGEDYYIAGTREIESDGTENITSSYGGCLKMVKEADIVRVGGDFLTYAYKSQGDLLTNGTMYIRGNFVQKYVNNSYEGKTTNFNATANHRIVFNGTQKQKIKFESPDGSGFANVTFSNPDIELESGIRGFTLNEDINLAINTEEFGVYGNALDLNHHLIGNELNVTKDNFTYTTGELNLSGNTLNITKNMTQSGGKIDLNGGTINIDRILRRTTHSWI